MLLRLCRKSFPLLQTCTSPNGWPSHAATLLFDKDAQRQVVHRWWMSCGTTDRALVANSLSRVGLCRPSSLSSAWHWFAVHLGLFALKSPTKRDHTCQGRTIPFSNTLPCTRLLLDIRGLSVRPRRIVGSDEEAQRQRCRKS